MRWTRALFASLALVVVLVLPQEAGADETTPDPAALKLLEGFMSALLIANDDASAKATVPFVHASLTNSAGDDLSPELRRFSFKKAHANAKLYTSPPVVVRVHTTSITTIGFKQSAEAGIVIDYFLAKKPGVSGSPAPVRIFFGKTGGPPKVAYMGSL